jgi:exosortase
MMALAAILMWGSTYVEAATTASLLDLIAVQIGVIGALLMVQQPLTSKPQAQAVWLGLALLAIGVGIRLVATRLVSVVPEMYSFVPAIIGVFLIIGGWDALRWAGAPLAFLFFMFPLPGVLDRDLLAPLQSMATYSSTYCLNTMGINAVNEQNKITLGESETVMEVVEACSGLRMLTIFIALAVAITMITQRPLWEKLIIVASAIPIALAVNIIRITVTGVMYLLVDQELADKMFHAMAGWFMMPMALGLLYVEFQVLSHLFIEEGPSGPLPMA